MTPKERRDFLFRKSRPLIRSVKFIEGDDYSSDIKTLWVSHVQEPWPIMPEGVTQEEFVNRIIEFTDGKNLYVADDDNKAYANGRGPIAICQVTDHGWKIEPHVDFFPWASPRNILRATVSFLHMMKYQKIGVCVVYSLKNSLPLFNKCCEYGVLHKSGMIRGGDPRGDQYIYSIRGKRK